MNKNELMTFDSGRGVLLTAVQTGKPDALDKEFYCPFCDGRLHRCDVGLVRHNKPSCKEWKREVRVSRRAFFDEFAMKQMGAIAGKPVNRRA